MQIYLLLTENCNLNCAMCIRGKHSDHYLDFKQLKTLPLWNSLKNHDVVLTGGEPTMHPQFIEIVNQIADRVHTLTVTTNGTSHDYLKHIQNKEKVFFQISLDGIMAVHDKIRGKNTWHKTMETIYALDKLVFPYCIATVVSKKNKDCMPQMAEELINFNNMRYWRISYEMPFGNAGFQDRMTAEEWNIFVDSMLQQVRFRMKIQKLFPFELYEKNKHRFQCDTKKRVFNCGSAQDKIYIYPDLNVYPCTCLIDFRLGNLMEQTLEEILNQRQAKQFSEYSLCEDSLCFDCEYKPMCNGGCIGMSYHYFGKLGLGDVRCPKLKGCLQ